MILRDILPRFWFLIAIGLMVVAGTTLPAAGFWLRSTSIALPFLTVVAIFASSVGIDLAQVIEAGRERASVALGITSTYLVAPILGTVFAVVLGPTIGGPNSEGYLFYEAVMLAAAQAGTIASAPALTLLARGNQALALLLTVVTNVLTVILTPLILRVALGAVVSFPVGPMMLRMCFVVLLPVVTAQLVRRFLWVPGDTGQHLLRLVSQIIILVFVYMGVSATGIAASTGETLLARLFAVSLLLHVSLLGFVFVGATLLRVDAASRTALVFCGSQKTLPNGIYLWDRFFPTNPYGALALVSYHVVQLTVDTLLVPRLKASERPPQHQR